MSYPRALRFLHWSIALLVLVQIGLIAVYHQLQSLDYAKLVLSAHRQCGTLVLILVAARILLIPATNVPPLTGFPTWQSLAARLVHIALVLLLVAQPVLGFLVAWARGDDVVLLGAIPIPTLVHLSNEQGQYLESVHKWTAYTIIGFVAVHLVAIAFNALVRRVSVTERMLRPKRSDMLVNRVPFAVQLTVCCGATLLLAVASGLYGAAKYKDFIDSRAQFDQTEVGALDDMRQAQVALKVLMAVTDPAKRATGAATLAATVGAFPARLSDASAKSAATNAAAALARIAKGERAPAVLTAADQQLENAVNDQFMVVFQGRLALADLASKGHDLIVLAVMPTLILGAVLAFLLSRNVLTALSQARGVVRAVESGAQAESLRVEGRGEFAQLMQDITRMRSAVEMRQQSKDAALRAQEAAQREKERLEAQRAEDMVQAIAGALAALAHGDLMHRLRGTFPESYERIRTDFNRAIGSLETLVCAIAEASHGIASRSHDVAHAAESLARRTRDQAADVEKTATALDEITKGVSLSARDAERAAEMANATLRQAGDAEAVVTDAIRRMGDIKTSSDRIGAMIDMIDDIARQTNFLSLNASLEAARAGDAGRGFGVVAAEVRTLALRSAEVAKEIAGLISLSRDHIDSGVNCVARTGEALQGIVSKVGEIDSAVANIAAAAGRQARNLDSVNAAVIRIDGTTQDNARMVRETTETTRGMDEVIGTLDTLTSRFAVSQPSEQPSDAARLVA